MCYKFLLVLVKFGFPLVKHLYIFFIMYICTYLQTPLYFITSTFIWYIEKLTNLVLKILLPSSIQILIDFGKENFPLKLNLKKSTYKNKSSQ